MKTLSRARAPKKNTVIKLTQNKPNHIVITGSCPIRRPN